MRTTLLTAALLATAVLAAAPKPAEIDKLLAPVALYPDALLAQMLLCTASPAKVVELRDWLTANQKLKGTELQDAATVAGFDPEFVALTLFPQVVNDMAERRDWTAELGKLFAADKTAVFDSIQRLRKQAHDAGNLKTTPQQEVETQTTSSGQQVIVIEPANPQVVYVPTYNPTVVYVDDDDDSEAIAAGLIGFTAGIALGAAIDNDYYYGPWGWHGGAYMYNDAWDDYYDHREDAREDWADHREDIVEERGERSRENSEQRTERTESRQDTRTTRSEGRQDTAVATQGTRTERSQATQPSTQSTQGTRTERPQTSQMSRGTTSTATPSTATRSGGRSDALSGYSSGSSTRAASSRGQSSRGASRGGGGGGRRR